MSFPRLGAEAVGFGNGAAGAAKLDASDGAGDGDALVDIGGVGSFIGGSGGSGDTDAVLGENPGAFSGAGLGVDGPDLRSTVGGVSGLGGTSGAPEPMGTGAGPSGFPASNVPLLSVLPGLIGGGAADVLTSGATGDFGAWCIVGKIGFGGIVGGISAA